MQSREEGSLPLPLRPMIGGPRLAVVVLCGLLLCVDGSEVSQHLLSATHATVAPAILQVQATHHPVIHLDKHTHSSLLAPTSLV